MNGVAMIMMLRFCIVAALFARIVDGIWLVLTVELLVRLAIPAGMGNPMTPQGKCFFNSNKITKVTYTQHVL